MIKSQMTSVYFANSGKMKRVFDIMREMTTHKIGMSQIIYNNKKLLLFNRDVKSLNSKFNENFHSDKIPKWNLQTEFAILKDKYINSFNRLIKNKKFEVQTNFDISKYKKKTKHHDVGDVKEFRIDKQSTMICRLVKYLTYLNLSDPSKIYSTIKNPAILTMIKHFNDKNILERIVNLAIFAQKNVINRIKLIVIAVKLRPLGRGYKA